MFSRACSLLRFHCKFSFVVSGDCIISWPVMNSGKNKKKKDKVEIADEKVVWRNFLFRLFQCYHGWKEV